MKTPEQKAEKQARKASKRVAKREQRERDHAAWATRQPMPEFAPPEPWSEVLKDRRSAAEVYRDKWNRYRGSV